MLEKEWRVSEIDRLFGLKECNQSWTLFTFPITRKMCNVMIKLSVRIHLSRSFLPLVHFPPLSPPERASKQPLCHVNQPSSFLLAPFKPHLMHGGCIPPRAIRPLAWPILTRRNTLYSVAHQDLTIRCSVKRGHFYWRPCSTLSMALDCFPAQELNCSASWFECLLH